ncbi:hypothetical protein DRQ25_01715 [Candidatus Fermentibacteria bacterium]|nr:MAG: hypothetical protein DRQ25_01715 [Candidatus Fermentibacteria bacterium]
MLYILKLGSDHRMVIDIIRWNKKDVVIRELKTDDKHVITWKTFMTFYEELRYECNLDDHDDHGSRLEHVLKKIR